MKKKARLQSAESWLKKYNGDMKKIVLNYINRYGVDWKCAFVELKLLGVSIDPDYENSIIERIKNTIKKNKIKKSTESRYSEENLPDQDMNFAYIAGYTSGGLPYGITWEEWEQIEK